MLAIPVKATDAANEPELSSILQPVMSMALAVVLVTSNQSAPTGLLPLDQGATSEMKNRPTVPGEPISSASFTAMKAPLTPTALSSVMLALFSPAALLNVANGALPADAANVTLAC